MKGKKDGLGREREGERGRERETLHAEFCKNILCVHRKSPNNACRAELGRYPLMINIQNREVKFYNHVKGSDSETFHNKAITYRDMNLEKSP